MNFTKLQRKNEKMENIFWISYSHNFVYSVKTVITPAIDPFQIAAAKSDPKA